MHAPAETMTFWDHLDALRSCLLRILLAVTLGGVTAFVLKEQLFAAILAPAHSDFALYRLLGAPDFHLSLINTGLTEQFMAHLKVAAMVGVLTASPYILYVLMGFIAPALYEHERRYGLRIALAAYLMFLTGVAASYWLVFPLTVRFLGSYQVSPEVVPMLSLSSYIDTLVGLSLALGLVFEMPVLSWLLARFGLLRSRWMSAARRHAVIVILVVAAIITPTGDMFTLAVVSLPIYLLYEASIAIVRLTEPKKED